jgi:hypothetical protein
VASLHAGEVNIDYSIWDGRIRHLEMGGEILVDGDIEVSGWRDRLWLWAEEKGLHLNDGHGWRAWVIRLAEDLGKDLERLQ